LKEFFGERYAAHHGFGHPSEDWKIHATLNKGGHAGIVGDRIDSIVARQRSVRFPDPQISRLD